MKQSTNAVSQSAKSKGQNSRKEITSMNLLTYIQIAHNNYVTYLREHNKASKYDVLFKTDSIKQYNKYLTDKQQEKLIEIYNYIKDLERSINRYQLRTYLQDNKLDTSSVHPSEVNPDRKIAISEEVPAKTETKLDIAEQSEHLAEIETPKTIYTIEIKHDDLDPTIETYTDYISARTRLDNLLELSDQGEILDATMETPNVGVITLDMLKEHKSQQGA